MGDFSILFTFTETGYRNRLQSSKERLILELSLPLYHIKRATYEIYQPCSL
ncbi:conserved protein of unknown function [Citrobacter amalonaticus]|uniref:Uncharacterized protein n=1 Tax=Citrobacter amalonaticus TaxID=35703 RepID=A0AAX2BCY9_CITAM|nr:conserved protein of unknown function [Citrobacter amalonaticus]